MNEIISSASRENTIYDSRLEVKTYGKIPFQNFIMEMAKMEDRQKVKNYRHINFKSLFAFGNSEKVFNSEFKYSIGDKTNTFILSDLVSMGQFHSNVLEFDENSVINSFNKTNEQNLNFVVPAKTKIIFFVTLDKLKK